ncbi:MAG: putative divalent heavy-metal cations transporter [Peptococcaceae bacterium]|nr:putative divalent heavy-metal cations transporter [Peptococcaceae bacterium]
MADYLASNYSIITLGLLASLAAGLATGIGSLPIFFMKDFPKKILDALLGFAAGVMLAATSFSLIIPAIAAAGGGIKGAGITLIGILGGGIFLDIVDKFFPDTNLSLGPSQNHNNLRKAWLFIAAITIHNFPEGLAVGVSFGDGNITNGISVAVAIGLQNMPEGLACALPLIREKVPVWKAFLVALATGLVEPLGGLLGIGIVQVARPLLPFALAFAAGAMLFVISHEIIPETQRDKSSKLATHSLLIGFVIMMFLDNVLE